MDRSRIDQAIQRIENALERIDAAAGKLGSPDGPDSDLAHKHAVLRSEVSATLKDLDEIIEGLEA